MSFMRSCHKVCARWRHFLRDRGGNVAMIFGLALIPLAVAAGSGIDFSRALLVRSRLAEALDAAGLAVGASQGLTQTQMQALAQNYFDANYTAGNSFGVPAPVSITFGNQQVSLSASVQMPTTLMNIVGIKTMDVAHTSKIVWGQTKLWVGLVLDNTGSMSEGDSSGTKIDALKSATHSLLTMLQNASSTPGDVKASIIPFSKDVSFKALPDGTSNINASWIDWSDWLAPPANSMPSASVGPGSSCPYSSWSNGFACTQGPANGSWNTNTIPSSGSYAGYICPSRDNGRVDPGRNGHYYNGCYDSVPAGTTTTSCVTPWGGSTSCTTTTSSDPYTGSTATACSYDSSYTKTCITRTGAPYTHNWIANDKSTWDGCFMDRAQSYDEQNDPATGGSTDFPAENASSCPPAQIAPLSYDWTALNSEVDSMTPNGNTNQTIGLAWGWQSLTDGDPMNAGTLPPLTQRVIILLSDGVNTQNRWTQDQSSIDAREKQACDNAKAAGVIIYTVFVDLNGTSGSSAALQYCASDPTKYFDLTASSQIATAFTTIGQQITNLRVAN